MRTALLVGVLALGFLSGCQTMREKTETIKQEWDERRDMGLQKPHTSTGLLLSTDYCAKKAQ